MVRITVGYADDVWSLLNQAVMLLGSIQTVQPAHEASVTG